MRLSINTLRLPPLYSLAPVEVRSESDLGSYTCTAENSVGTTREDVTVTGEPLPAVVTSPDIGLLPHSYTLHWTAGSLFPLTETRLLLREVGI